ncbi:TlpA disulfide reductase family protein [Natronoflexus pectinivorans]|nr:TlpA disulfide reductase family protein [Natronoflexus pectinivorans]
MKTFLINVLTVSLIVLFMNGCKMNQPELVLSGDVINMNSGTVYLQRFDDRVFRTIDSVEIIDGRFSFEPDIDLPEIYGLATEKEGRSFLLFLEKGEIHVTLDPESNHRESKVDGSSLHDQFVAYRELENVNIREYIKEHPKSLVSAYALYRFFSFRLTPEELRTNIDLLDTSLHDTQYVKIMQRLLGIFEDVAIGKKAPNFSAQNPEGEEVFLYDKLNGNYLLVEFWASWCVFCRRENPNLVKAHDLFHEKGFDILGVSLDRDFDAWVNAIEDDHLKWTNISDLKFWASEPAALFGVRALPSNFLLDPEGNIIAQNLKGEELFVFLGDVLAVEIN